MISVQLVLTSLFSSSAEMPPFAVFEMNYFWYGIIRQWAAAQFLQMFVFSGFLWSQQIYNRLQCCPLHVVTSVTWCQAADHCFKHSLSTNIVFLYSVELKCVCKWRTVIWEKCWLHQWQGSFRYIHVHKSCCGKSAAVSVLFPSVYFWNK